MKKNQKLLLVLVMAALTLLIGFRGVLGRAVRPGVTPPSAQAETTEFKLLKVGTGGLHVRQMQTVLQDLGYYDGKIDGNFSRVFEAAVKAFQKDFGLSETGQIDHALYSLLLEEFTGFPDPTQRPSASPAPALSPASAAPPAFVEEDGQYTDKDHVAAYIRAFGRLPSNYITKQEAQSLGWVAAYGNLWQVAPGKSIGGDRYGNYEGSLPYKSGRQYYECDIDSDGRYRSNGKRIVFSNDGLIFYTEDHYQTFEEI